MNNRLYLLNFVPTIKQDNIYVKYPMINAKMQRKIFVYSNSIFVKIYIKDMAKRNAKIILGGRILTGNTIFAKISSKITEKHI